MGGKTLLTNTASKDLKTTITTLIILLVVDNGLINTAPNSDGFKALLKYRDIV